MLLPLPLLLLHLSLMRLLLVRLLHLPHLSQQQHCGSFMSTASGYA